MSSYLIAFCLGLIMDALCTFQHVISAKNRWLLSFPNSLMISACIWINTGYVVDDKILMFSVFSIGGAFGSMLGVWYGNYMPRNTEGKEGA